MCSSYCALNIQQSSIRSPVHPPPRFLYSRLKRDNNRMDAAEALALLQLIEAQEEARHRPVNEDYYNYLFSNGGENNPDEEVWMNSRTEPSAHFFSPPMGKQHSAYEPGFYGPAKRFMVAKRKKRSSGLLRHG